MGLDAVELVLAFEEEFGINIPDSAAEKIRTPRDVIDFVIEERRRVQQMNLRSLVCEALAGMGFPNVEPTKNLNDLFAGKGRVARWDRLGRRLAPFSIPRATAHGPAGKVMAGAFVAGVICLFLGQWMLAGIGAVIFAAGWLWRDWSMRIPDSVSTPQRLIEHLTRPISDTDIADTVKEIVIEQLGLKDGIYGEDKRFIEDLGME